MKPKRPKSDHDLHLPRWVDALPWDDPSDPPNELTYDHVIPRMQWRGDPAEMTNWGNIVTACWDCNQRKRNRTPAQAGMRLLRKPVKPKALPPMPFFAPPNAPEAWREWLPQTAPVLAVA